MKGNLTTKKNFTSFALMGSIFIKYVMNTGHLMSKLQKRIDFIDENNLNSNMADLKGIDKIKRGSCFGDFSEIKGRIYKQRWIVSVSNPLVCLKIGNEDMIKILNQSATNENLQLLMQSFASLNPSNNFIRKLCRYVV